MGHYLGEMEDRPRDRYNYRAVNDAGFKSVSTTVHESFKECPRCFAIVRGERALDHLATPSEDDA